MTRVDGVEIERKYLLTRCPGLPAGARSTAIEQGYLPDEAGRGEGRVRRARLDDGSVRCTLTVKRGTGLVRSEREEDIDAGTFETLWATTAGRRIIKTRHHVPGDDGSALVWEIDVIPDLDLVLAEVELDSPDQPVLIPEWLAEVIVREVTGDAAFQNYTLATTGRPPRLA